MPSKYNRSSEHDIALAVMKYLVTVPSAQAKTATVKKHVQNFINLTADDHDPSGSRPQEEVWQQVVGNIVSHRNDSPDNFINRGLLAYRGGYLILTDAGRNHLIKLKAHP